MLAARPVYRMAPRSNTRDGSISDALDALPSPLDERLPALEPGACARVRTLFKSSPEALDDRRKLGLLSRKDTVECVLAEPVERKRSTGVHCREVSWRSQR
jgi:hypothetical protein